MCVKDRFEQLSSLFADWGLCRINGCGICHRRWLARKEGACRLCHAKNLDAIELGLRCSQLGRRRFKAQADGRWRSNASRRDGRVADCAALEMLCGRNVTGGSNPPLSACRNVLRSFQTVPSGTVFRFWYLKWSPTSSTWHQLAHLILAEVRFQSAGWLIRLILPSA